MNDDKKLEKLAKQIRVCIRCELHRSRTEAVPGDGPTHAEIMLIGEGPGANEDKQGRPFVGASGKFLDQLLEQAGVTRSDVWITNVVKCRPPNNRDPEPEEAAKCSPYLQRQIALIKPKLIVAMGRHAAQTLLGTDASIAKLRGRVFQYSGVPLIVTYHPAYLLRNLPDKSKAWEDLLFARKTIGAA